MILKFAKIRKVKSPIRGHSLDAGIDFFIPEETLDEICLPPHTRICIPSGIKVNIPKGWALVAHNKSSIAHGLGIHTMADVIDAGVVPASSGHGINDRTGLLYIPYGDVHHVGHPVADYDFL